MPLEDIRDLMGHTSIQMTLRYAHVSEERLRTAARLLEGELA
jgi:site-specific recombinase XerD